MLEWVSAPKVTPFMLNLGNRAARSSLTILRYQGCPPASNLIATLIGIGIGYDSAIPISSSMLTRPFTIYRANVYM